MLYNLEVLRSRAGQPGWREEIHGKVIVMSASMCHDKISLHVHWTQQQQGRREFLSRPYRSWTADSKNYRDVADYGERDTDDVNAKIVRGSWRI